MKSFRKKIISATLLISMIGNTAIACQQVEANTSHQQSQTTTQAKQSIKIALLLDTSNSMDGLIDQAKSQLWTIVNELATSKCNDDSKPALQIALYEYGNDRLPASEGHIRQVCTLTDDLDLISEKLFSLKTNGGNEYCGQVIETSLNQLEWGTNEADVKMIFIAGNEPFTQGNFFYKTACEHANKNGVTVNTIFCGDFQQGVNSSWKDGADITKGTYMSIQQNRQTVFIESPYDDKIDSLNTSLNGTYIPYGNLGRMKKENQIRQDANAATYSKANKVKRSVSKSSGFYRNKKWDLVDLAEGDNEAVEEMEEKSLPEVMKNMSTEKRKVYVAEKSTERKRIQTEIQTLNTKRRIYVAEKRKNTNQENSLDKVMIDAVKIQANKKGLKFQ